MPIDPYIEAQRRIDRGEVVVSVDVSASDNMLPLYFEAMNSPTISTIKRHIQHLNDIASLKEKIASSENNRSRIAAEVSSRNLDKG